MNLQTFIHHMPKVELHIHLEGAIQPATLLRLAERNRAALPADTVQGLRAWYRFSDFEHFVQVYLAIQRCLWRRSSLRSSPLCQPNARPTVRYFWLALHEISPCCSFNVTRNYLRRRQP